MHFYGLDQRTTWSICPVPISRFQNCDGCTVCLDETLEQNYQAFEVAWNLRAICLVGVFVVSLAQVGASLLLDLVSHL